MTSRDFCYWLQGIFEVANPQTLDKKAVAKIKAHLSMVFIHELDPSMGDKEHQDKLQEAHDRPLTAPPGFHPASPSSEPVYKC